MSIQTTTISNIDVGKPSPSFQSIDSQHWEKTNVRFHGFENLSAGNDVFVKSPEFACFGHRWGLQLYPGGRRDSNEGKVALFLAHQSGHSIATQFGFSVKDKNGEGMNEFASSAECMFSPIGTSGDGIGYIGGRLNFAARTEIISALVEGTLIVEVRMRQPDTSASPTLPFIPENPPSKFILKKFNDEESADVIFVVGDEKVMTAENKKAKTSTTTFYAHRLILEDCAPELMTPCKSGEGGPSTIPILDTEPEVFHHLLYYAYGGKVAEDELEAYAADIIHASDKYGVVGLKLEAEATLVATTTITTDNVMELLLCADEKNCALLKEAAMDFLAENLHESVEKLSFENAPGYLMKDLMTAIARGKKESDAGSDATDLGIARVGTLRKKLHEKGLHVDGSREAMIALLKENS